MQILVWASILQWLGNCRTLVCWISCFGPEYLHQVLFGIGSFGIDCKIFRVFHAEGQPVMSLGFRHFTSLWFLGNPKFCRNIIIPADVSGHLMMNKLLSSAEIYFSIKTRPWSWFSGSCLPSWCALVITGFTGLGSVFLGSWRSETGDKLYQFDSLDHIGRHWVAVLMKVLINRRQSPAPPSETGHAALMGEAQRWNGKKFPLTQEWWHGVAHKWDYIHSAFNVIDLLSLNLCGLVLLHGRKWGRHLEEVSGVEDWHSLDIVNV